jgi:hypothetical protein
MQRKPSRFEFRLSPELGDRIDNWRRQEKDIPVRAEAARRLIEAALDAAEAKQVPASPAKREGQPA